jgi:glycosyl transferase family 25
MRIVVINLQESAERRASMRLQLTQLDLAFTFFEAVDASRGFSSFAAYDERKYLANTGRRASPEEAACFASHLCLWKHCVASGEPMLILEDDAEILPSFLAALAEIEGLIQVHGFIRVQEHGPSRHIRTELVKKAGAFDLHYFASCPFGAMAYAISPRVAAAFIERSSVLSAPVDVFIRKFWEHGQPLFGLSPGPIASSPLSSLSTIKQREKGRTTPSVRFSRIGNKANGIVGRIFFNLAYRASVMSRRNRRNQTRG